MSAANLLNLNVDTLYEQHSVAEIDIVHKKIQAVVENKREELRTMVGERYRDLLQAADTIGAMKNSANTLIAQVKGIRNECGHLNEKHLIGFKPSDSTDLLCNRNANKQLNNYFSTMVQIKLLTSLPELIWSHIDQERFYTATVLFIFSRHISTGLQLDANNPLMQHLPVANKQWEILKPFHVTIKQQLMSVLEREELSAEGAADCLLSLLLLEKGNLNGILNTFLQLRCAAFHSCLSAVSESGAVVERCVKERILVSLKVLNSTINLLGKCFSSDGLLFSKLEECTDPNAPPTIALMDSNDAQFAHMLPDIIASFRPKLEPQALDNSLVHAALEQWLNDTKRIANVELKQIFKLVDSMSIIQEIKQEAHNYKKQLNFVPIVENFQLQQSFDFYELQYVPLINRRVRDIIQHNWTQAMQHTLEQLQRALPQAVKREHQLWKEQMNDLPSSLEEALNEDRKCKRLLMKTKGYDQDIIELCTEFDRQLESIVNQLNVLLEEQATRAEEKLSLVEFLRETAQEQLTQFLSEVKKLNLRGRQELLFTVRVCVALVELCPHLRVCFSQQSSWRQWVGNAAGNCLEHWQRICALFEAEAFQVWQQIVDDVLEQEKCKQRLPTALSHNVMLEDFANWDTVTLEQNDEEQNTIHSSFQIPNQPSISLQMYLFSLIRCLNTVVPQTMPSKVLQHFNYKLLTKLLNHYKAVAAHPCTSSSQNVALQLYFDLKFLQSSFAVGREDRLLCDQFHMQQNILKEHIDPFDFELFAEHIIANVKRSVARLHCELGVLMPRLSTTQTHTTQATSLAQEKHPNVLTLSACGSTTLWFPLLPIVTAGFGSAAAAHDSKKSATVETEKTTPSRKAATSSQRKGEMLSKSKSGAASFFGAMSQEWFR